MHTTSFEIYVNDLSYSILISPGSRHARSQIELDNFDVLFVGFRHNSELSNANYLKLILDCLLYEIAFESSFCHPIPGESMKRPGV